MKKLNEKVFCRNNRIGELDFYLSVNGKELYLFTTSYFAMNTYREYHMGKRISEVYSKTSDYREQKLRERILRMRKYVAEEEQFSLPEKKKRRVKDRNNDTDNEYEVA